MPFEEIVRSAVSRLGVVRVSNALNPLLYITLPVFPISCLAAWMFADDPVSKYGLLIFGGLFPLACLAHYTVFAFRDPDRLQSEQYLARKQELSIIERKGPNGPEIVQDLKDGRTVQEQETARALDDGDES